MTYGCEINSPLRTSNVFDRVHVSYAIIGTTVVQWDLRSDFQDPPPHTFQLQVGQTENPQADDWEDVGEAVVDAFYAVDMEQRDWGALQRATYRVSLTTARGEYVSEPTAATGVLDQRNWTDFRYVATKWTQMCRRRGGRACKGWVLKARIGGGRCICTDLSTGACTKPLCPLCYGTGRTCGYFAPMPNVWALFDPQTAKGYLDPAGQQNSVLDAHAKARMLACPLIEERDVWVNDATDERWLVTNRGFQNITEIRGIPVIVHVPLHIIDFGHPVYRFPIPR